MKKAHLAAAAVALIACARSTPAAAFPFLAQSMDDWAGCDSDCKGESKLKYTDDQIKLFSKAMKDAGHSRSAWWRNQDVWATDLVEDKYGGEDHIYADPNTLYIYSGHGGAPILGGKQRFVAPFCHTVSTTVSSCETRSSSMVLGERTGSFASSPGNIRYMILATCHSVDTKPNEQWGNVFYRGVDMIFGYRGVSADSSLTDEVPEDFAEASFDDNDRFKAGWFWAIEDWWIDDTGSLVTAGVDKAQGRERRDKMRKSWPRRGDAELHTYRTWTWHEG